MSKNVDVSTHRNARVTLRTAHGNGAGALLRVETLPADELPKPDANATAAHLADRQRRGKPFQKGNRAAAGRKPALALLGIPVDASDPIYRRMLANAARYRRKRVSELGAVHGYVSSAAAGMVASAALALAGSRYAYALAASSKDPALLKLGSQLANDSRQAELAAFELASREGAARPPSPQSFPWLVQAPPAASHASAHDVDVDTDDASDTDDDRSGARDTDQRTDEHTHSAADSGSIRDRALEPGDTDDRDARSNGATAHVEHAT